MTRDGTDAQVPKLDTSTFVPTTVPEGEADEAADDEE